MSADTPSTSAAHAENNETKQPEYHVIDKRHFLNLEEVDRKTTVAEKPRYPSYVEELMARVTETERRFEEKKLLFESELARTKARLEADYARRVELEKQKVLLPILDVLDNLERALAAAPMADVEAGLRQGVEMTASLFRSRLQSLGVEAMDLLDKPFDPNAAQAVGIVTVVEANQDGTVKEEVLRGYRLGEQVFRPAQVLVGKLSESQEPRES